MIDTIKKSINKEFPDIKYDAYYSNSSNKYKIIESLIDDKIMFRNIIEGGQFGILSLEEIVSCIIETTQLQLNLYQKLDKIQILKDKKTITYMEMADPINFHTLTDEELQDKIKKYEIKQDDFIQKDILTKK